MTLRDGEKYRCSECNAEVSVIRSSNARRLDNEL